MTSARSAAGLFIAAALMAASTPHLAQQQEPAPVFRSTADFVAIDVQVMDASGRPVLNLDARDFSVDVDGNPRPVVSVEYVTHDTAAGTPSGRPIDPDVSTNQGLAAPRLVILVIDAANTSASARQSVLDLANRLIARLSPSDRVGLAVIPESAAASEFSTDRDRLRSNLDRIAGWAPRLDAGLKFSISEAVERERGRGQSAEWSRVAQRVCGELRDPQDREICIAQLELEANALVAELSGRTSTTVGGLTSLLRRLATIDRPKTLLLLSEQFITDGSDGDVRRIAQLAGAAQTTIRVLRPNIEGSDVMDIKPRTSRMADERVRLAGLEELAGWAGGAVYQASRDGSGVIDRIVNELGGYYLIGLEVQPGDRDDRSHDIRVRVQRAGATVRARRQFAAPARTSPPNSAAVVAAALRDPVPLTTLPLAVRTYRIPEQGSKVRIIVSADVGGPATTDAAVAVGFALLKPDGQVATSGFDESVRHPARSGEPAPLHYLRSVVVEPGEYRLVIAAVDRDGRAGSLTRPIGPPLRRIGPFLAGDLVVAALTGEPGLRPPATRNIDSRQLGVALTLAAGSDSQYGGARVAIEIAEAERTAALVTTDAPLRPAPEGGLSGRVAQARFRLLDLPAGTYVARAVVSDQGVELGRFSQTFNLTRGVETGATTPPPLPAAAPAPVPAPVPAPAPPTDALAAPVTGSGPRVFLSFDPLHGSQQSAESLETLGGLRDAFQRRGFRLAVSRDESDVSVEIVDQRLLQDGAGTMPSSRRLPGRVALVRTRVAVGTDITEIRGRSEATNQIWRSAGGETARLVERWLDDRQPPASGTNNASRPPAPTGGAARAPVDLVRRVAAYVGDYQKAFATIIGEEAYLQEYSERKFPFPAPASVSRRRLRSELGLAWFPATGVWFGFRDVIEVDGKPVKDRQIRMEQLFLDAKAPSVEQFERVADASGRFNLGPVGRNFNVPLVTLLFVSPDNLARSTFELRSYESVDGRPAAVVAFTETARPTLIRRNNRNSPARGLLWVAPDTGEILKTDLALAGDNLDVRVTTWFQSDDKLGMLVPARMREVYDYSQRIDEFVEATATYSNFRRFEAASKILVK